MRESLTQHGRGRIVRIVSSFAGAALALAAFCAIGNVYLDGYRLDLGSLNFPTPRYLAFIACWTVFGGISASLLAVGLCQICAAPAQSARLAAEWNGVSERHFLIGTCGAAVAIPLLLRLLLMHGAPIADDESAYRFAAQLLASGRLSVPSPPLKIFFDQNFMINDGRLYPVYFLGWPALLAVGIWIHASWFVNPVLSAATVFPLLRILEEFAGLPWARGGVVLFLFAPFVQLAAATLLSHTACLMALTWALYLYLRARQRGSFRDHAAFGFALALAFCIRPQSTVALGLPLVIAWFLSLRHVEARVRIRAAAAFSVPCVVLGVLFLGSLWVQNGSPWRVGYAKYCQYMVENKFRFTTFGPADLTAIAGFEFSHMWEALARTASGLLRLSSDLFGWPSSFAFVLFALFSRAPRLRLVWGMAASFIGLMMFQRDWGIDTIGPVHAFELSLPIIVLTIVGANSLTDRVMPLLSPCLLGALIATAWIGFVPVRLEAVRQIAEHVNTALLAPERQGLHQSLVFAPWPFAPQCKPMPAHFVWFHPTNDPDLQNDILWVNHIDVNQDRRLLDLYPERRGYVLRWNDKCDVVLEPLPRAVREDR